MIHSKLLAPTRIVLSTSIVLLFMLLQPSCKKADILSDKKESTSKSEIGYKAEQFFELPANASSALQRVARELQRQNKTNEFVKQFISKEGFPIWTKASMYIKTKDIKNNPTAGFDAGGLSDTTVLIPLVWNAEKYVHGFISANVADSVTLKIFRQNDYVNFPFQTSQTPTSTTSAESFALRMMLMDKEVFGSTEFEVKDKRLFNYSTVYGDTANAKKFVRFDSSATGNFQSNGSTVNNIMQIVCVTITTQTTTVQSNHCPYPPNQCPDQYTGIPGPCDNCGTTCANVSTTYNTIYHCEIWNEEEGWPSLPGGGSTGGGGNPTGGGGQPPCGSFGANMVEGVVPINCEAGPGGNPWPPVVSIFSDLNNPVNASDTIVVQSTLIEIGNIETNPPPPIRIIGKTQARGNTEDMEYGNNCDASGILSNMPNFSDNQLFSEMNSLFTACTIFDGSLSSVGNDMIQQFKDKIGGYYTNTVLDNKVFASSAFKSFIKKFGEILNQKLAYANWNINNVSEIDIPNTIRPRFTGTYNKFHGLQILVNDTEQTIIELNNFSFNQTTHQWTANITVTIKDHFGLDKNDAFAYQNKHAGFAAWWILQHCRGYVPFETNVKISLNLICDPQGN